MGAVFGAHHSTLGRDIAIKILHPELTADPLAVKRFEREAQRTSMIAHANCVRVTDYAHTEEGIAYLAMELLVASRRPHPRPRAAPYADPEEASQRRSSARQDRA